MSESLIVSIIVPVYNVEKYIEKCLQSVVEQTYKNIECIIIDDCSPDNSKAIIDIFIEKYPHIFKYMRNDVNVGQGKSRECGVNLSIGSYIAFLDSDDYLLPTFIEETLQHALDNDADMVTTNHFVDKNDQLILINRLEKYQINKFMDNYLWGRLYKRQLILDFGVYLRIFCEDIPSNIRLLANAKKMLFIKNALYGYVYRPGSTLNSSKTIDELKESLGYIYKELKSNDIFDNEAQSFMLFFVISIIKPLKSPFDRLKLYRYFIDMVGEIKNINDLRQYSDCSNSNWRKMKSIVYLRGLPLLRPRTALIRNKIKRLFSQI